MSIKVGDVVGVIGQPDRATVTKITILCQLSDGRIANQEDLILPITIPRNVTNNGVYIHPRSWPTEDDRLSHTTKL